MIYYDTREKEKEREKGKEKTDNEKISQRENGTIRKFGFGD